MELPGLARALLPGEDGGEKLVRLLRRTVRHGGDQQQLLPPAQPGNGRQMARTGAQRLLLCGQGEPLSDADEEAQGLRGAAGKDDGVLRPFRRRSEEHTSELQSLMRNSYA